MKKILLFCFLTLGFVANARFVQVTFNDGYDIYVPGDSNSGFSTSDAQINSILAAHNVYLCVSEGIRFPEVVLFFDYTGIDISAFVSDLNTNTNVLDVELCYDSATLFYPTYADGMYIKLLDDTIGIPTGVNANGNIITNNDDLNLIFDTFSVKNVNSTALSNYFEIYFEGDITELKNALDSLDTVIELTGLFDVIMLLSNNTFEKSTLQIYPNPFSTNFTIKTEETILNYSLTDISGKQIITTYSKEELDTVTSQLFSGIYLINLQLENGNNLNYKLVKN